MEGTLFAYKKRLVAFESAGKTDCAVVFIGGLTNGLFAVPYIPALNNALREKGTATLVQPLLTSSYGGFGVSSLDRDADEIRALLRYLIDQRGFVRFVLVGHSTGCQDIVHLFRKHGGTTEAAAVCGAVLQGPVSDREDMRYVAPGGSGSEPQVPDAVVEEAAQMIREGRGGLPMQSWMYCNRFPITAERLWSLCGAKLTMDDMFSSDLTDDELRKAFELPAGKWPAKVVVAESMNDEYVPPYVDKAKIAARIAAQIPGSKVVLVPDTHAVESEAGIKVIVDAILSVLP